TFALSAVNFRGKIRLSDVEQAAINTLWNEAQKQFGGRLFNGQLYSFVSLKNGVLTGNFVDYKFYIAQLRNPKFKTLFNISPVAISCICCCQNKILIGKRSAFVTEYPNCYELSPSGGIDPSAAINGKIDLIKQTLVELEEEAAI